MSCARMRKQIALYVGDDLSVAERMLVRQHVQTCDGCAGVLPAMTADRQWLENGDEGWQDAVLDSHTMADLHAGLTRRLQQDEEQPSARWGRRLVDLLLGRRGLVSGRMGLVGGVAAAALVAVAVTHTGGSLPAAPPTANPPGDDGTMITARDTALDSTPTAKRAAAGADRWRVHWTRDPNERVADEDVPLREQGPDTVPVAMAAPKPIEIPVADPSIRILWLPRGDRTELQ